MEARILGRKIRFNDQIKAFKKQRRVRKYIVTESIKRCRNGKGYTKKGSWHLLQEQAVKFKFIKQHRFEFTVEKMCKVFKVSISGFYKNLHRKQSKRAELRKMLTQQIQLIYVNSKGRYGSPRIVKRIKYEWD